jgi:hypothetical protein
MKRTNALVVALATVMMTTAANAEQASREEIQAPRGQDVQAPRTDGFQAEAS